MSALMSEVSHIGSILKENQAWVGATVAPSRSQTCILQRELKFPAQNHRETLFERT